MTRTITPTPYTLGFELFWSKCRPGRKGGKQAAQRAWNNHGLEGRAQQVADTMDYMVKNEYMKGEARFTPHASTWINAGFYDTEIPDPEQEKQDKFKAYVDSMVAQGYARENWIN